MIPETLIAPLASGNLTYLSAGAGELLLVLHTSGGPLWTPLLDQLAAVRRVVMPVLPGFGLMPMRDGLTTVEGLADLIAEFVAETAEGAVDLFGASFGGRVALHLAARHPGSVGRLVLEAPAGVAVGADPATLDPQAARTGLFAHPEKAVGLKPTPELAASNGAAFRAYGGPSFVDEVLVAALPGIDAHTLILMGTLDPVTPIEAGRYLVSVMPHANLTYIYDAAHAVQVDQADAMFRLVRHFLDKGPAFIVATREYA